MPTQYCAIVVGDKDHILRFCKVRVEFNQSSYEMTKQKISGRNIKGDETYT